MGGAGYLESQSPLENIFKYRAHHGELSISPDCHSEQRRERLRSLTRQHRQTSSCHVQSFQQTASIGQVMAKRPLQTEHAARSVSRVTFDTPGTDPQGSGCHRSPKERCTKVQSEFALEALPLLNL